MTRRAAPSSRSGGKAPRAVAARLADAPTQPKRRCLLVAEHLSHYREGVYRLLDDSEAWDFTFVGGPATRDGSIPGIPDGALRRQLTVTNRWLGRLLWQSGLLRLCYGKKYDAAIFVGNASFLTTWIAAVLMRLRGTRVYFWTIGWHKPDSNRLKRVIRTSFYRLADHLLLYGQDGHAIAVAAGLGPAKMTIIGNSYSQTKQLSPIVSQRSFDLSSIRSEPGVRYVGAVARLTSVKRFDMLIRAVRLLRDEGHSLGVILAGDGPLRDELATLSEELEVPLLLTGGVYDEAILAEIYAKIAVTVIPERAGLTVIQSIMHGVPVVTVDDPNSQVPEFRAVIPGRTGLLYERGNLDDLSVAILKCLGQVDAQPNDLADACRQEAAENWSPASHARRLLKALE